MFEVHVYYYYGYTFNGNLSAMTKWNEYFELYYRIWLWTINVLKYMYVITMVIV